MSLMFAMGVATLGDGNTMGDVNSSVHEQVEAPVMTKLATWDAPFVILGFGSIGAGTCPPQSRLLSLSLKISLPTLKLLRLAFLSFARFNSRGVRARYGSGHSAVRLDIMTSFFAHAE